MTISTSMRAPETGMGMGTKFHEAGNRKFKEKKFGEAAKLYTMALR